MRMIRTSAGCFLLLLSLLLGACRTAPPVHVEDGVEVQSDQFHFQLPSGRYYCEQGISLNLKRDLHSRHQQQLELVWRSRTYLLQRDPSVSGLPRYEDPASGLVWIDLPWKGVLLDGRTHTPIASECRS